jgi:hypothetical protein
LVLPLPLTRTLPPLMTMLPLILPRIMTLPPLMMMLLPNGLGVRFSMVSWISMASLGSFLADCTLSVPPLAPATDLPSEPMTFSILARTTF